MLWGLFSILAFFALVLLTCGVRGRRCGDAPHCRACGFDLRGLVEIGDSAADSAVKCPECGCGLSGPRAVARGAPRGRPVLLAAGALSLLLACGAGTLAFSAGSTTLESYKPGWLLMLEARQLRGPGADAALAEILRRRGPSPLGPDQLAGLVDAALDAQSDLSRDWRASDWWGVLDAAFSAGRVSATQAERFSRQAIATLAPNLPPGMLAGEPWPARTTDMMPQTDGAPRVVPAQGIAWLTTLELATLDGSRLELMRRGSQRGGAPHWTGLQQVFEVASKVSSSSEVSLAPSPSESYLPPRLSVPPGEHRITLRYRIRACPITPAGSSGGRPPIQWDTQPTWTLESTSTFTAFATPEEAVQAAGPSDGHSLGTGVSAQSLRVMPLRGANPETLGVNYSISRDAALDASPWIVGRIELRSGGRTWAAMADPGDATPDTVPETIALAPSGGRSGSQGVGGRFLVQNLPHIPLADVVIVPDLRAAAVRGLTGPVWGEEIVIRDVPLVWDTGLLSREEFDSGVLDGLLHPTGSPARPDGSAPPVRGQRND